MDMFALVHSFFSAFVAMFPLNSFLFLHFKHLAYYLLFRLIRQDTHTAPAVVGAFANIHKFHFIITLSTKCYISFVFSFSLSLARFSFTYFLFAHKFFCAQANVSHHFVLKIILFGHNDARSMHSVVEKERGSIRRGRIKSWLFARQWALSTEKEEAQHSCANKTVESKKEMGEEKKGETRRD